MRVRSLWIAWAGTLVAGLSASATAQTAGDLRLLPPAEVRKALEQMSGGAVQVAAPLLGLDELKGKPTGASGGPPGRARAPKLRDVAIGAAPNEENEPTAAANPVDKRRLVAGSHSYQAGGGLRCVAYRSTDGGASWSTTAVLPQLTAESNCSDPVVAYAPDGSRAYYAYMDIKVVTDLTNLPAFVTDTVRWDIIVSHSDDDGATWSAPVVALLGDPYVITYTPCPSPPFPPGSYCGTLTDPGYAFDKNWIGTHEGAPGHAGWVYVTATRFDTPGASNIAFTRSSDRGATWSPHQLLDSGGGAAGVVVQGSRPVGTADGGVLVAYYHSGNDGWLAGRFQIRTRYSPDHGSTWGSRVVAVDDAFEAPFWLGPHTFYKRWWSTMFPDVAVDASGTAHLLYTHDPVPNGTCAVPGGVIDQCSPDAEDGDVRYAASEAAPYAEWTQPQTVNDDGLHRAQGFAAMNVRGKTVWAIWEDTRLAAEVPPSPIPGCFFVPLPQAVCDSSNVWYDIFGARNTPGAGGFSRNFRVTEESSVQDFVFTGDYTDLATNATTVFGIFTDRRHQTSIFAFEDNVFGSRIIAGGGLGR